MKKVFKTMDGNEAAAYSSYAFTEIAAIYPITPSSPMAEAIDKWSVEGRKNIFGNTVDLVEMQSEAGAISTVHGALDAGSLATTYTASQGLMLMIPTMFRIAGQAKPGVIHVASRNVATSAISIFAEHSDVMATRSTGFALLASSNVQEAMDLGAVAHLAAIKGHIPFLHFFDGFRTSHEIQKVALLDYDELAQLVDYGELQKFRDKALNPENPVMRTTGQNPDTYFQQREAINPLYDSLPDKVEECMQDINRISGKDYHLFNYYGDENAEYVLIGMGSVSGVVQETVDYLNSKGKKVGYIDVHLFRPFSVKHFLKALPESVRKITVLDRDKEPGAIGEPLFTEIAAVLKDKSSDIEVLASRYGLASKDTTPAQIIAMYENMENDDPKNHYTMGIIDDVTFKSLPYGEEVNLLPKSTISCKFWGIGGDGTVGANKNSIKIIGDHTDLSVQAYFEYDGKKSGGVTRSHLRFGKEAIKGSYLVNHADFVAVHIQSYLKFYDVVKDLKEGGNLLINTLWEEEEIEKNLPKKLKRDLARKNINLYYINATKIAQELGLGSRTNTVLQSAFFSISNIIPKEDAKKYMKDAIVGTYGHKGDDIINMNFSAVDAGFEQYKRYEIPEAWENLEVEEVKDEREKPKFVTEIMEAVNRMEGDSLPVSTFTGDRADGTVPQGTSKYEKRGVAVDVPEWDVDNCIQCNQCSYVCPHAAIRPFLLSDEEVEKAPSNLKAKKATGKDMEGLNFAIGISVLDCTGCGSCAFTCPAKDKALSMKPLDSQMDMAEVWDYLVDLPENRNPMGTDTVKGSQFEQPLLEFSGACAGCGETPYAKLVTQLYGKDTNLAIATGCNQVWSTSYPSFPYTTDKEGNGPAAAGSLFENNAEFGLGIHMAAENARKDLKKRIEVIAEKAEDENLKVKAKAWLENFDNKEESRKYSFALKGALDEYQGQKVKEEVTYARKNSKNLIKKYTWIFGGDGWAYDIGYGGLDHVVASGADVNVLVMDTEVYSNTGGQASKSTPQGARAEFASAGKLTKKKDLGMMLMDYEDIYVAQVSMGANMNQTLRAFKEAASYDGPSVIIAYSPCINHGIRRGMNKVTEVMKDAVDTGYWLLYRHDPRRREEGENPFLLDSKEPNGKFQDFLRTETRYLSIEKKDPERAKVLFSGAEKDAINRYRKYKRLAEEE